MKGYTIEFVNDAYYGEMRSDNRDAQKILKKFDYNIVSPISKRNKNHMADILFEEHYEAIDELVGRSIDHDEKVKRAKESCEVTRKHMNGFAEWKECSHWWKSTDTRFPATLGRYTTAINGDVPFEETFTIEELIDKYFEQLNKQEHDKV